MCVGDLLLATLGALAVWAHFALPWMLRQVMLSIARNIPTQFWSTSGLRNNSAPSSNSNQEVGLACWVLQSSVQCSP